jgi:hypothetical protein
MEAGLARRSVLRDNQLTFVVPVSADYRKKQRGDNNANFLRRLLSTGLPCSLGIIREKGVEK